MLEKVRVNNKDYRLIKLLGKGKGGYSYLCIYNDKEYVIKQIHHETCDYYTFGNKMESELADYEILSNLNINIPKMLDYDKKTECIVKEYVDGLTIYELVLKNQLNEKYFKQIFGMCDLCYKANINIDYFPTNFIIQQDRIYYIDFECNKYMEQWNFENWGIKYWLYSKELVEYAKKNGFDGRLNNPLKKSEIDAIKKELYTKYKKY